MQFYVFTLTHDLQIFGPIIEPVAIDMMDDFTSLEWAIENLLHDQAVLVFRFAKQLKAPIAVMNIPCSFWCHGDFKFPGFVFSHIMHHAKLAGVVWTRAIQYRAISKFRKHALALSSMIVFLTESSSYTLPSTTFDRAIHGWILTEASK